MHNLPMHPLQRLARLNHEAVIYLASIRHGRPFSETGRQRNSEHIADAANGSTTNLVVTRNRRSRLRGKIQPDVVPPAAMMKHASVCSHAARAPVGSLATRPDHLHLFK